MSLGERGRRVCAQLHDICSYFSIRSSSWVGSTCLAALRASHSCMQLSVISLHVVFCRGNEPPPCQMITPTANKHLCMGEAWLDPQIVLTPSECACASLFVSVHDLHSFFVFFRVRVNWKNLAVSPASTCVGLSLCVSMQRTQRTMCNLILKQDFEKLWALDTPHRAKLKQLQMGSVTENFKICTLRHSWAYLVAPGGKNRFLWAENQQYF